MAAHMHACMNTSSVNIPSVKEDTTFQAISVVHKHRMLAKLYSRRHKGDLCFCMPKNVLGMSERNY